jgi:hypothetical protein
MRGHTPTSERTWDSTSLDRRIMVSKVPLLSEADLSALKLELKEALNSINDQLEQNTEADPDWVRRARAKQRIVCLFLTACREEGGKRQSAAALECSRLKTQRQKQTTDQEQRRASKRARVIHALLLEEWGKSRTDAFYNQASELADALLAQEDAQASTQQEAA